jgi:hypothetical protein
MLQKGLIAFCAGLLFVGSLSFSSCKSSTRSDNGSKKDQKAGAVEDNAGDNASTIKTHLEPLSGSKYAYTITNETTTELEVNSKTINMRHRSDVGITYDMQKDSTGNYLLKMHFNNIHLYSKTGENETEFDAGSAETTLDPTGQMLGLLKEANISATISPAGKVVAINGYKELGEKIIASFTDENSRNLAKGQWEKVIGEGMIKKNIEQLFSTLPNTVTHVGDTWKKDLQQKGEIDMNVASTFKLKNIEEGVATIESEGEITSDKAATKLIGYAVTSDLKGEHQGEYAVETSTGMVLKNITSSKLEGTMEVMGKEVPVTIKTRLTMNGKKEK